MKRPQSGSEGARRVLRPLVVFYLLALLIVSVVVAVGGLEGPDGALRGLLGWYGDHGGYANTVSIAQYGLQDPRVLWVFVFAGAPSFAALLVSWGRGRWAGVRRLLLRLQRQTTKL